MRRTAWQKDAACAEPGYQQQYGFNSIVLMPVNLYGPGDKFNPFRGHMIPVLIKKLCKCQGIHERSYGSLGDGSPTRGFLYVEDATEGILLTAERYHQSEPVSLGSVFEISIKGVVELIMRSAGFVGEIV